jgi:hypothetical protein
VRGYPATFAAAIVGGSGNSFVNCTLRNCVRYGLTTFGAVNFYVGYCTVESAQYCVSGSGSASSGGLIEHNVLRGMLISSFKVKMMQNVVFRYNYVDLTPTLNDRNPDGVNFSDDDGAANVNVVVENNEFVRVRVGDYAGAVTYGVTVDAGCVGNSGNRFVNNVVTNCVGAVMYGVVLYGDYFTVTGNSFTGVTTRIIDNGVNNVTSPNTYH